MAKIVDKIRSILTLIGCVFLILGFSYIVTVLIFSLENHVAPQGAVSASPPDPVVAALSHPIPYTATVTQDGRTRFYIPKEAK